MNYYDAINRLAKWRSVFAGRWLGTRPNTDPECIAVRDVIEKLLLMRVELSALTNLLIDRGDLTIEQVQQQIAVECAHLEAALEKQFPGFKSNNIGMDIKLPEAAETMKGWRP